MLNFIRNSALVHALGKENMLFAFRSIITQKLRSFLTLLGIVAGVATVIAMVSFVAGFNEAITGAFSTFGTTLVQFQKFEPRFGGPPELIPEEQRRRHDLTLEDASALKRLGTLSAAVSPERYLGLASAGVTVKNRQGAEANGPTIAGVVPDSGEGRWAVEEAVRLGVPLPAISAALFNRFRSQKSDDYGDRLSAALRHEFGGHEVKVK